MRNLVVRPNAIVQESVFESLTALVRDPALYPNVMSEVVRWVNEDEPRRSAGLQAFLRLATPGEDGQVAILPGVGEQNLGWLADLWRVALRDDKQAGAAARLASRWLDVAARDQAPREPVLQILAGSCQSSIDVGRIAWIAFAEVGPRENNPARYDIAADLVQRTWKRDPIYTRRLVDEQS